MLAGNCFRGIGSDTSELERTWKAALKVLCWGNRLRWRNTSPSAPTVRKRCFGSPTARFRFKENMAHEAHIREEIKRKVRARLAQHELETCEFILLESRFICGQCFLKQIDDNQGSGSLSSEQRHPKVSSSADESNVSDAIFSRLCQTTKG